MKKAVNTSPFNTVYGKSIQYAKDISNPNLLINGSFRINQRNQSSYSGVAYGVDRWRCMSSSISMAINSDNSITFSNASANNGYIKQIIEDSAIFAGRQVTLSVVGKVISGSGLIGLYYRNIAGGSWIRIGGKTLISDIITTFTAIIPKSAVQISADIGGSGGSLVSYKYAKLEVGSVATVLSPSAIADEVQICQRYYIDFCMSTEGQTLLPFIGTGVAYSNTLAYFFIPTPTTLRAQGSFIYDFSKLEIITGGAVIAPTVFSNYSISQNGVGISLGGSFTAGQGCVLRAKEIGSGILAYQAELT